MGTPVRSISPVKEAEEWNLLPIGGLNVRPRIGKVIMGEDAKHGVTHSWSGGVGVMGAEVGAR